MAHYTGWVHRKLASFTYDDLTFSLVCKQLPEYIHCLVLRVTIHVCYAGVSSWAWTSTNGRDFRVPMLAAWDGLCANITFSTLVFGGDNKIHLYNFPGWKHIRAFRNVPLYNLVSIFELLPADIKMVLLKWYWNNPVYELWIELQSQFDEREGRSSCYSRIYK
jgi:hypothetical protein